MTIKNSFIHLSFRYLGLFYCSPYTYIQWFGVIFIANQKLISRI